MRRVPLLQARLRLSDPRVQAVPHGQARLRQNYQRVHQVLRRNTNRQRQETVRGVVRRGNQDAPQRAERVPCRRARVLGANRFVGARRRSPRTASRPPPVFPVQQRVREGGRKREVWPRQNVRCGPRRPGHGGLLREQGLQVDGTAVLRRSRGQVREDAVPGRQAPLQQNRQKVLGVPADKPFYDEKFNECLACPEKFPKYNPTIKACESCPDGQPRFEANKGTCKACPSETPLYDKIANACLKCPADRPLYDAEAKECKACPAGEAFGARGRLHGLPCEQAAVHDEVPTRKMAPQGCYKIQSQDECCASKDGRRATKTSLACGKRRTLAPTGASRRIG